VASTTTSQVLTYSRAVTTADYPALEKISESAVKDKQKFERLVVSKEDLLKMFEVRSSFSLCASVLHRVVQQIQKVLDRDQDPRWYLHHCLSLWTNGRSLCRSSYTTHW